MQRRLSLTKILQVNRLRRQSFLPCASHRAKHLQAIGKCWHLHTLMITLLLARDAVPPLLPLPLQVKDYEQREAAAKAAAKAAYERLAEVSDQLAAAEGRVGPGGLEEGGGPRMGGGGGVAGDVGGKVWTDAVVFDQRTQEMVRVGGSW